MSDKYKYLINNTAIFAIGTFGSKILTYLIVPLYTYILSTEDYGTIDLFTTTISLMLPFTTFVIYEGIIRFLISKEINEKCAITLNMVIFGFGIIIVVCSIPFISQIFTEKIYIKLYIIILLLYTYNQIFSQYLRACGKSVAFTINGIIITIVTLLFNIIFLLILKKGVLGYLYSLILAQLLASIQSTTSGKIIQNISIKAVNWNILRKILLYCIPLIPNNLMWWIMNAGDKYIISYYMGISYNGIYSLAIKIPTILNLMYSIFMQAWQLSAIQENGKDNQETFYSNIYKSVMGILIITSSIIILTVKPIFIILINNDFISAWKYVPLLCIAMVISCMATFMSVTYMINKSTKKSFFSTFVGACINLTCNFLFIHKLGLYGVALGTILGYLTVYFIRAHDTKKNIRMSLDITRSIISFLILFIQTILLLKESVHILWLKEIILVVIISFLYKKEILLIIRFTTGLILSKKEGNL